MDKILEALVNCYLFDIAVFSNKWMYIPFLIPVIFYLMFFMIKWAILTLPAWLPIMLVMGKIQPAFKPTIKMQESKINKK